MSQGNCLPLSCQCIAQANQGRRTQATARIQYSCRQQSSAVKKSAAPLPLGFPFHLHFIFWSCPAQRLHTSPAKGRGCSRAGFLLHRSAMERKGTFPACHITRHHQMHKEEVRLKKQNQKLLRQHPGTLSLGRSRSHFSMDTWTGMFKRNITAGGQSSKLTGFRHLRSQDSPRHELPEIILTLPTARSSL